MMDLTKFGAVTCTPDKRQNCAQKKRPGKCVQSSTTRPRILECCLIWHVTALRVSEASDYCEKAISIKSNMADGARIGHA